MDEVWAELNRLNPWWQVADWRGNVVPRAWYLNSLQKAAQKDLIAVLIGMRRVGKTSLFLSHVEQLLASKVNPKQLVYISFSERLLTQIRIVEFADIIRARHKLSASDSIYLFLDEVQEKEGWQDEIKYVYDLHQNIKLFVTGSSAVLLSQKTSSLTGRFAKIEIFPLSFNEYLDFTNNKLSSTNLEHNRILTDQYLNAGGVPDMALGKKDKDDLRTTIESILYRDITALYGIRNPAILKSLYELLADCTTTPVGTTNLEKTLGLATETAVAYLQYLQDAYVLHALPLWSDSRKKTKSTNPKYYLCDLGVLGAFALHPRVGHLAETAAVLHAHRLVSHGVTKRIGYQVLDGGEIDLVVDKRKYEVKINEIANVIPDVTYITRDNLWKFLSDETGHFLT